MVNSKCANVQAKPSIAALCNILYCIYMIAALKGIWKATNYGVYFLWKFIKWYDFSHKLYECKLLLQNIYHFTRKVHYMLSKSKLHNILGVKLMIFFSTISAFYELAHELTSKITATLRLCFCFIDLTRWAYKIFY